MSELLKFLGFAVAAALCVHGVAYWAAKGWYKGKPHTVIDVNVNNAPPSKQEGDGNG